ncbi:GTPase Era [Kovacikia minuta]|uniref:GTPase Era n=1 Tax=Kovacikia minuta TaxID=2931930 RepID=UPI0036F388F1
MSEMEHHFQDGIAPGIIPPSPPGFRSGFVGIIGRPNVGKSTLMNYLVGQKIAITSPVAQTTRNRLRGILTTPTAQLIFIDTPGIHKPHHQLGEVLVKNARIAIRSVDVLLFVVDGSVELGGGDRYIADLLKEIEVPVILGINKADQQREGKAEGRGQRAEGQEDTGTRGHGDTGNSSIQNSKFKIQNSPTPPPPTPLIMITRTWQPLTIGRSPNSLL